MSIQNPLQPLADMISAGLNTAAAAINKTAAGFGWQPPFTIAPAFAAAPGFVAQYGPQPTTVPTTANGMSPLIPSLFAPIPAVKATDVQRAMVQHYGGALNYAAAGQTSFAGPKQLQANLPTSAPGLIHLSGSKAGLIGPAVMPRGLTAQQQQLWLQQQQQ